ncbi:MAG: uracil phosphoribosyltransferase [Acidilobus sp.]
MRVIGDEIPYARWLLARLRDRSTAPEDFRRYMREAGRLIAIYASRDLEWVKVSVTTPLGAPAEELDLASPPLVVGVLGAALPLVEGFTEVYPSSRIGLVAARRFEEKEGVRVELYYRRLPSVHTGVTVVLDPMLATGKTVGRVVEEVKKVGAGKVIVGSVIASRPGLNYLTRLHPDATIYSLAVDPDLNSSFFIVPGLGDAGDRALGVTPD